MANLKLFLLGPPRFERDDTPFEISRRKGVALLAYLAVTRQRHSRDALAALLWPEANRSRARAALRQVLWSLNRSLAGTWLETTGENVSFQTQAAVWVDVAAFQTLLAARQAHPHPADASCPDCIPLLTEAVALYRDDFLAGFTLPDSPAFDDWHFFELENLRNQLSEALARLTAHYMAHQAGAAAIPYARRWAALDPLLEPPQQALMELYAWTGQRAAALRQYQEYRRRLAEQLDLEPTEALTALDRRIRRARERSQPPAGEMKEQTAAGPVSPPPAPVFRPEDEIRLATVLSAGLSDAAGVSWKLPPEEMVEAATTLLQIVTGVVSPYNVKLEQFAGGEVRVIFGVPQMYEDDPERAVRAALDIRRLANRQGLSVTSGVSTGEVYLGPTAQNATVTAMGAVVNQAAWLQDKGQADQVLVSAATYQHTRQAFAFEPVTFIPNGKAEPITAYQVDRILPHPPKVRSVEGLQAALTGRDEELERLQILLASVRRQRGQLVLLSGEAGLGKSRLIAELKAAAVTGREAETPLLWLESRCLALRTAASYWPFIDMIRNYLYLTGSGEADQTRSLLAVLANMAAQGRFSAQRGQEMGLLLGNLLSLRFGNDWDDRLEEANPRQLQYETFLAVYDFFTALAQQQPVVLIFEDLHWADDLSLDLIALLMEAVPRYPILLVCVYRPQQQQHQDQRLAALAARKCPDCYTEIRLRELTPEQSDHLVVSLLAADDLPAAVKQPILERARGNPFFVEEAIRALIDAGVLYRQAGRWRLEAETRSITVPERVQSVILSRVDRLEPALKQVLRAAAVIGHVFPARILSYLTPRMIDLDQALGVLEEAALIYRERIVPEVEYTFKHVLIQETVYQTISRRQQADLHWQVASALETHYQANREAYYEALAYHYSRSPAAEKAIDYLLEAGEKSRRAYLNDKAIHYFQQVLGRLADKTTGPSPDQTTRLRRRLAALTGLGQIYHRLGWGVEAEKYLRQAIEAGREAAMAHQPLVRLYYWLGEVLHWQGRYRDQARLGETGLALLAADQAESVEAVLMNQTIAVSHLARGDFALFRALTERTAQFIRRLPFSEELRPAYIHIILNLYNTNRAAQAEEWLQTLAGLAEKHANLRALAEVADYRWGASFQSGRWATLSAHSDQAAELYARIGDIGRVWRCRRDMVWAYLLRGELSAAEDQANRLLEALEVVASLAFEAEAYLSRGLVFFCQEAWLQAAGFWRQARELAAAADLSWVEWMATYCLGRLYLTQGRSEEALRYFQATTTLAYPYHIPSGWWLTGRPLLAGLLSGLETAFAGPEEFRAFCEQFEASSARRSISPWPDQLYLDPAAVPRPPFFSPAAPFEGSDQAALPAGWVWDDPFGDGVLTTVQGGVEIQAANGRDLWRLNHGAPRLLHPVGGDFIVQTACEPVPRTAARSRPAIGGLLLWRDTDNFLRLVWGAHGRYDISFEGCLDHQDVIIGRGLLPVPSKGEAGPDRVWLRLERRAAQVKAWCSLDEAHWFSAGQAAFLVAGAAQAGLHAAGWIDRTVYPGAYPDGSAIRFASFRLWERDG